MRTSRKADFRKLKITLVTMTYHSQCPQCPSLSPHVLLKQIHLSSSKNVKMVAGVTQSGID